MNAEGVNVMRINYDWLIGCLIVGIPLAYIWFFENKRDIKVMFIIAIMFATTYAVFYLLDKIFESKGDQGRLFASIFLLQPVAEVYDVGKISVLQVILAIIIMAVYVALQTYSRRREHKRS